MNDETALRKIAHESIAAGLLPNHPPLKTWGGPGSGVKCALCGTFVDEDQLEFEVEFGPESGRCYLHLACFSAWDTERKALLARGGPASDRGPAEASPSSAPRSEPKPADRSGLLLDRRAEAKIGDHGGGRACRSGGA